MSFEGFWQVVCEKGHESEVGYPLPSEIDFRKWNCAECKAMARWINMVDDTNLDAAGKVTLVERPDGTVEIPKDQGQIVRFTEKERHKNALKLGWRHGMPGQTGHYWAFRKGMTTPTLLTIERVGQSVVWSEVASGIHRTILDPKLAKSTLWFGPIKPPWLPEAM